MLLLQNIKKNFEEKVICDFTYHFKSNNIYRIVGINGIGKTTLLKIIKGIYIQDKGEIKFTDHLSYKDISYVDDNHSSFIQRLSVLRNLEYFHTLQNKNIDVSYIIELLNIFGVNHLRNTRFSNLSQGQMQMISVIRSLTSKPKILLLDEAFSSLDSTKIIALESFLQDYIQNNCMIIYASHDNSLFRSFSVTDINL